jgi:hypothetical protein
MLVSSCQVSLAEGCDHRSGDPSSKLCVLLISGIGDETDADGNPQVSYLNGKPVLSTIGDTPLEAWSKCLIKLGMVDELILDQAFEAVRVSKEVAQRDDDKPEPPKTPSSSSADPPNPPGSIGEETPADHDHENSTDGNEEPSIDQVDKEPVSEEEQVIRDRVAALRLQLENAKAEDEKAAVDLADTRIELLGRFLINPFGAGESDKAHQASWMAAAVRKEKTKMGSTGNKRKIVTATDLIERNDTFFNPETEALLEGLPGSEYCTVYDYQANRGAVAASSKWLQEQKAIFEKEAKRRTRESKEAKVKASLEKEKEMKRKLRDDERDARKRQKLDEEEEKKKTRIQERLKKLKIHVDDKLFKEASFQREKVVLLLAKNLNKEFARRRKAAEQLSREALDVKKVPEFQIQELPALANQYDEDIVRIWDFIATFDSFFVQSGYMQKRPTLDELQTSIDTLRGNKTKMNKAEATTFVTQLAVALCKPLSAGITRLLFASLIALNPVLQKDFGAAFFNEINSTKIMKDGEERHAYQEILLPVDTFTWKEIARIAFQSDALGEIGYARQDAAHVLRGYRSAGHPNSKEARRIRRVEDHPIALLRQMLSEVPLTQSKGATSTNAVRVDVPSADACGPSSWIFYLYNINSMEEPIDAEVFATNLSRSFELANMVDSGVSVEVRNELESLSKNTTHATTGAELTMMKRSVAKILEEVTGEIFSSNYQKIVSKEEKNFADKADLIALQKVIDSNLYRARMGELDTLKLSETELRQLTHLREVYMADALRLKEEMKRQDEDDEDDDDDEEDDGKFDTKKIEADSNGSSANIIKEEPDHDKKSSNEGLDAKEGTECDVVEATRRNLDKNGASDGKLGKETPYDDFCADIPTAPELLRRCLAVTRALCLCGPSEPFIFPVDPQSNPGYYDMLLQPMCMREVGLRLQQAANAYLISPQEKKEELLEKSVADFARNVRLIGRNCLCYVNAGPMIIAAGGEMLRIFERLLLDWVLAPPEYLAPLHALDDDLCVDSHPSDVDSTVLLCDGCEGNFNISRLNPPLVNIPKGDWYCPRCISGRWWGDLDPRIGKTVKLKEFDGAIGTIRKCLFAHAESTASPSFMYEVELESGTKELATLVDVDEALREAGVNVPRITCLEAVTESSGYGAGIDNGLRHDLVPVVLHPKVSDAASQVAPSSSVFRDLIAAASTLLINDSQEMKADEWLRLLSLLIMKCSASDIMQNVASEMEDKAAERLAEAIENISKNANDITDVLPRVDDEIPAIPYASLVEVEADPMDGPQASSEPVTVTQVSSSSQAVHSAIVVEASAVEIASMHMVESSSEVVEAYGTEGGTLDEEEFKLRRTAALAEKAKRQKSREDSIAAFCIKNQIRSTVASFEQDNVSQVIEATLNTAEYGLTFSASRCRHTPCHFCSLPDTSLGAYLVRVPDAAEWDERIKFGARSQRTNMIAEIRDESQRHSQGKKLLVVSVRVGDDIVADEKSELDFDQTPDGGMLEFLPRNPEAFQEELEFRYQHRLPFITGSLSAHETCAISVHNARKVKVVQDFKDRQLSLAELEQGNTCGRSLEICRDKGDRAYWSFHSEPESLFVSSTAGRWYKYSEPEAIASVIVSLGKDPAVGELKRVFPKAWHLLKTGLWTDLLLKRRYKTIARKEEGDDVSAAMEIDNESAKAEAYEEHEKVLVKSKDGTRLWDAQIKAIAKNSEGKITGYRVHYEGWGCRFDEWISEDRAVEANDNNREVQAMMRKDADTPRGGLPASLGGMEAGSYLFAKDRARGTTPLPDFARIAHVPPNASEDLKIFATMKAAVLAIEAALPLGSVNHLDSGSWSPKFAGQWRLMVQQAEGPWNLMRCVILLEDVIGEEWIKEQIGHLRLCLPSRWKALDEACPSSLALRIFLLDRAIMYGTVDRRRYRSRSKK